MILSFFHPSISTYVVFIRLSDIFLTIENSDSKTDDARVCLLRKGRVCYVEERSGHLEEMIREATLMENENVGKVFFLSPNVEVKQVGKKVIVEKEIAFGNDLSWMKTKRGDDSSLSSPSSPGASVVSMSFDDEDSAVAWKEMLLSEISTPKLPKGFYNNMDFCKKLNSSIWRMILEGNESIRALYFSLTESNLDENGNPIDVQRYLPLIDRVREISLSLLGKHRIESLTIVEDADIMTYLLYRISLNKMDRALLLLSDFELEDMIEISEYAPRTNPPPKWLETFQSFWKDLPSPTLRYIVYTY